MDKLHRNVWLLIAVAFATAVTIYMLSYIVTHPWNILPDIGGDGAKNNFTYLWHSMHGHGYWFTGMNYPYGEHIVYTDGQPLITVLLTHFKNVSSGTALTVLWWLVGLSYVLAIVFVYRILQWFRVAHIPAMLFAGLIVVMAPQVMRLNGHYALCYTCVMPMLFYWTILYNNSGKWRYCVYIFIMGIMMAFLHPYYMAMMLVWVMSYILGYFIFTKLALREKLVHVWPVLVSVLLVFLLVAVVMKSTDGATDRPITPLRGSDVYTSLAQLLSSKYSTLWQNAISLHMVKKASDLAEGFGYIGIITALTILVSVLMFIRRRYTKKQEEDTGLRKFPSAFLFAAVIILLLSMGIPFIWKMEWLLDNVSGLKQFRTLGRFNWIFYYIITIYSAVTIYSWYSMLVKRGKRVYGYAVLSLAIMVWAYDASGYTRFSRQLSLDAMYHYDLIYSRDEQGWDSFLQEKHFKHDDFQAIILLPFFHVGTEKLWVGDPGWLMTLGSRAALQLQLPIVDVMLSRSSWSVAQKQVKLVGGPFADKAILRDAQSDKPFLLFIVSKDRLAIDERYLLDASDYIGDFSGGKVYACYPGRIAANDKKYRDIVNAILPYMHSADTCIGSNANFYLDHLDGSSAAHLFGPGAANAIKRDDSVIAMIPVQQAKDSEVYELSCWFLLRKEDYASPNMNLHFLDATGKDIGETYLVTKWSVDSKDLWFRSAAYFYMPAGCRSIKCILLNVPNPAYVALDELLLRPAGALVVSKGSDGSVMANNHLFRYLSNDNKQ